MAKPLTKKQPLSSIDRFLDKSLSEEAIAPQAELKKRSQKAATKTRSTPKLVEKPSAIKPPREVTRDEPAALASKELVERTEADYQQRIVAKAPEPRTGMQEEQSKKLARREIAPVQSAVIVRPQAQSVPTGEAATIKREMVLTSSAAKTLDSLVRIFQDATGAEVTRSHLMRGVLGALGSALPEIEREATAIGPLKRPSNAKGYEAERDDFEQKLGKAFLAGVSRAGEK